jgi:hypothetical protein
MKAALISLWLFVGLAGLIFHLGPGQELRNYDTVNQQVEQARTQVSHEKYSEALTSFDQAMAAIPEERTDLNRQLRLEKAKTQMLDKQLPEARLALESLMDELMQENLGDSSLGQQTREALANAQYYVTWLMRLEGAPREEWESEIEASRQNYRLLAERAERIGDALEIKRRTEDVEAAVRLARLDLSQLQALPLPCQCQGCKSCNCKGKKPGKKKSQSKNPAKGAGNNPPNESHGS